MVPSTGHIYAVWMNDFDVYFSKSTNNGATWSAPVKTYGKVSWNDKPILAVSDDGQHVYVAWNGPSGGGSVHRAVARRGRHVDADQGCRLPPLLLRVRR